jgi:protein-disulfide isomerase
MKQAGIVAVLFLAGFVAIFFWFQGKTRALSVEVQHLREEIVSLRGSMDVLGKTTQAIHRRLNPPPPTAWVSVDDDAAKGDESAPVTIVEFSEFQCPFCARFSANTLPQIRKAYVDTGKVKFVFRDYPLSFHEHAAKAAEAAECAGDQGMYWEMHDILFENHENLEAEAIPAYAEQVGLFMPDFLFCLESGKNAAEVQQDIQDGKQAGVSSTPSFFIGVTRKDGRIKGTLLKGAKPFDAFRKLIEEKLKEAGDA